MFVSLKEMDINIDILKNIGRIKGTYLGAEDAAMTVAVAADAAKIRVHCPEQLTTPSDPVSTTSLSLASNLQANCYCCPSATMLQCQ